MSGIDHLCKTCVRIRQGYCDGAEPDDRECQFYRRMTNADKIRAMTDEELDEFLMQTGTEYSCPPPHYFGETGFCRNEKVDMSCRMCWLDWLKQEVTDNG